MEFDFNRLDQYAMQHSCSQNLYGCAELAFLPQRWPKPSPLHIAPTHGGMARLSWPGWLLSAKTVYPRNGHPSISVLTGLSTALRRIKFKLAVIVHTGLSTALHLSICLICRATLLICRREVDFGHPLLHVDLSMSALHD